MLWKKQTRLTLIMALTGMAVAAITTHAQLYPGPTRENSPHQPNLNKAERHDDLILAGNFALAEGFQVIPDEILVAFWPDSNAAQVGAVRRGLAAREIKVFRRIGVRHWQLPPGLGVEQAVRSAKSQQI